jgi:hypothetical protein
VSARRRRRGRAGSGEGHGVAASELQPAPWRQVLVRATWLLWLLATAAMLWSLMFRFLLNSDLWFHLAAGRQIWERRSIPVTDQWSFTAAGHAWHNHEWLSGLLFYGWSRLFGIDSLVYWQWLVVGCAYLLLYRLLARLSASVAVASGLAVLALAVGVPFFDIRPNLWSVLGFVVLISLTLGRERPAAALPLLFAVWVNLHGGVILGLLVLPLMLAATLAANPGSTPLAARLGRAVALWFACVLATCINPWGWRVFSIAIELAVSSRTPSRTTLYEWLPPWVPGGIEAPLFPLAVVLALASIVVLLPPSLRAPRRAPRDATALGSLGLALLTLAMALQSRRFIPFFAIAQSLLVAQAGHRWIWTERWLQAFSTRVGATASAVVALATIGVAAYRLAPYPLDARAFDPLSWASKMPVESVNFLEANGITGELFAYHLWGGYVEYRAAGRLLVHLDPRAETVFDAETQRQHFQVLKGAPGWEDLLVRTGAELVLWPMHDDRERAMGRELANSGRWRTLYRDGVSLLLARHDLSLPEPLRETPDSAHRAWARGRLAMDERRYAAAVTELERAMTQDPRLWPACQDLAVAQAMLRDRQAVVRTVDSCQRIFPFPYLTVESLLGSAG